MRQLFGTDGIRGRANQYPMTAEMALALGRALTAELRQKQESPKIIIGKDTRLSGYMLENALVAGITSMGGTALLLGPLPTPAVAYLIRAMRAAGGVMISASHNPYYDNGLKVFGADGFKLDDRLETRIEHLMTAEDEITAIRPNPDRMGRARRLDDALGRYLTHLKTIFRQDFELGGKRIVFDAANGAAYDCGRKLFEELGADVVALACQPNGRNINADCAQADPSLLQKAVLEHRADLGIAVDGDADRLLLVDELGQVVTGEHVLFAMATFLKEMGRLKQNTVVTTIMANQALDHALQKQEIQVVRTQVGDRYVTERMRSLGAILGGETSGHYVFLDQNTTADGLFSALEVLALLLKQNKKASSLSEAFRPFPQILRSYRVQKKKPMSELVEILKVQADLERDYGAMGRVSIRFSGTENSLRVLLEGPENDRLNRDFARVEEALRVDLEVVHD